MARSTVNEKASRPQDDMNNGDKQTPTQDNTARASYASKHTSGPSAEGDKQPMQPDSKGKTQGGQRGNRSGKRAADQGDNGDVNPDSDQKMDVSYQKATTGQYRHDNVTESDKDPRYGKKVFEKDGYATDYKGEALMDEKGGYMKVDEEGYVMDSSDNYMKDSEDNYLYASKDSMTENVGLTGAKLKLSEAARSDISADLGALLESEELPEDFRKQATTIFEAAVGAAVDEHVADLNEKADQYFTEAVEGYVEQLNENIDEFLDYVVEKWLEENEVAVNSGIRANIAESFMSNLHGLLEGHYVDVPDNKADLVSDLSERVEEQDSRLNDQLAENARLNEQLKEATKELQVERYVQNMVATKADRMRKLAENVEFDGDADALNERLDILYDNYLNEQRRTSRSQRRQTELNESDQGDNVRTVTEGDNVSQEEHDPVVEQYAQALSKMSK